jgi:cytochrome b
MSKVLIWDLPTRVIHWTLTAGFLTSFGIAQLAGEHSPWFPIHMIVGITLGLVVLLRIAWGIVGTRYAKFSSFAYRPSELFAYLKDSLKSTAPRYTGHNPGSAYSTYAMLLLLCIVVVSGVVMSYGSEAAEEIHVPAAYALAIVVALHIVGVLWHSWRHRENLTATMITGWKTAAIDEAIPSSRPIAALIFAGLIAALMLVLFSGYDQKRSQIELPLVGTVIHLGEPE